MTQIEHARVDRAGLVDHSAGRISRAVGFVKTQGLGEVLRLVRQHGVKGSAAFITRNLRHMLAHELAKDFDRKHGVDTAGSVQLATLDVLGPNRHLGNECVCTSPRTFRWLMERAPIAPGATFIDIGAGKARTLLLASLHEFGKVRGVEFARELVNIAKTNIDTFRPSAQKVEDVEIVHADAGTYDFPPGPLLVFFYNPFGQALFDKVIANLATSLRQDPRPCTVVYTSSNGTVPWATRSIGATGTFKLVNRGRSPFFADAVRTVDYVVFSGLATGKPTG